MKVPAYYSTNKSDPDVYHDHSDCPAGQLTPSYNTRQGTNDRTSNTAPTHRTWGAVLRTIPRQ